MRANPKYTFVPLLRYPASIAMLLLGLSLSLPAYAQTAPLTRQELQKIDQGFKLFTSQTFGGNGRTCSTCHLPDKNYNISPADIAGMTSAQRKLVFAASNPELENPTLVQKLALFNINDTDSPGNSPAAEGPFRASMTIAGLNFTLQNNFCTVSADLVGVTGCQQKAGFEPVNDGTRSMEIGWSGDGAMIDPNLFPDIPASTDCRAAVQAFNADPTSLTQALRIFSLTAVRTHNPRTLERIPGIDFRCPTSTELDNLAAFQQWLGRRFELDLAKVTFNKSFKEMNPGPGLAEQGQAIFMSDMASCNRCHVNGGSSDSLGRVLLPEDAPPAPPSPPIPGANKNSHTSADLLRISETFLDSQVSPVLIPPDKGDKVLAGGPQADGQKAGGFNVQSLIEAPRKTSFFHNNGFVGSVEEAAGFYFTDTFDRSQAGAGRVRNVFRGGLFGPEALAALGGPDALDKMGFFLRSLSAIYSLADCERLVQEMITRKSMGLPLDLPFQHCRFALADVRKVIDGAKVRNNPYAYVSEQAQYIDDWLVDVMNPTNQYQVIYQPLYLQSIITDLHDLRTSIASTPELP